MNAIPGSREIGGNCLSSQIGQSWVWHRKSIHKKNPSAWLDNIQVWMRVNMYGWYWCYSLGPFVWKEHLWCFEVASLIFIHRLWLRRSPSHPFFPLRFVLFLLFSHNNHFKLLIIQQSSMLSLLPFRKGEKRKKGKIRVTKRAGDCNMARGK